MGTFTGGTTMGSATVNILSDIILERTETFTVTIVPGTFTIYSISAGPVSILTVSIVDNTSKCNIATMCQENTEWECV